VFELYGVVLGAIESAPTFSQYCTAGFTDSKDEFLRTKLP
jgi:hypothetical protein